MNTGINTMILRYADILLIYAEAVVGENGGFRADATALAAFNKVRERANLEPKATITMDDILHERRVEFAFEGDYRFDIQRQGFAKAKQIIEAQNRGTADAPAKVTLTENYMYLPIPAGEILQDPALGGLQNIVFTNSDGKSVTVPFMVIALASVADASNYNFTSGTEVTLRGNNLDDVTKVVLTGTSAEATIISKSRKQLVISLPATDVNRATLDITNASGTVTTTQEFVNVDKAFQIFTEGYMNGFENASWGPAAVATDVAKSGTKSFAATYAKGNWSADGFANWWPGVEYSADYKYLTFWVKGASADYTFYITGDQRDKGYGNADQSAPITVPKNVLTYFKIPLSTLELWKKGGAFKQLGFWIKGPDAQDETFCFNDVMLVK